MITTKYLNLPGMFSKAGICWDIWFTDDVILSKMNKYIGINQRMVVMWV